MKKALIIVDVQNDFCAGGSLAVPGGNEVIPYINELTKNKTYDEVIFTQDWHPSNHKSFASNNPGTKVGEMIILNGLPQVMWPDHCVQESSGAEFQPTLDTSACTFVVKKGKNTEVDTYSAFQDNDKISKTGLADYLKEKEIGAVEVTGLALDYCVKATCLDARAEGLNVSLHFRGTRAVNVKPKDGEDTIMELLQAGVDIIA